MFIDGSRRIFLEEVALLQEELLVDDVADCFVLTADGGGHMDGLPCEEGQVDEEVLA